MAVFEVWKIAGPGEDHIPTAIVRGTCQKDIGIDC